MQGKSVQQILRETSMSLYDELKAELQAKYPDKDIKIFYTPRERLYKVYSGDELLEVINRD